MRRAASLILLLSLSSSVLWAEEVAVTGESPPAPPAYKMLRFTEDYSWLSDPAKRGDLFDPIKYIPLRTNEPDWYLTLGGEARERFEGNYEQNFGIRAGDNSYWMQRLTLLGDLHLGQRVRFFVEGISGLVAGESLPAPAMTFGSCQEPRTFPCSSDRRSSTPRCVTS